VYYVEFKETTFFTKQIAKLLNDDEAYRGLQAELLNNPEAGDLIPGTGGLRKIRCAVPGKGKRGGIRAIYYFIRIEGIFYMLFAYLKGDQEDLTHDQKKALKKLVEGELT
jgi:hypothetical protein